MSGGEIIATTPELWDTFIEICNSFGINTTNLPVAMTTQEIVEYCQTLNVRLEPLYRTIQDGWTWVVNEPVNPAETTDMVVRGVTDLVVAGGGATSISRGKKVFGTVSKKIAAGAMIAALGVSTFAAQIGEHINRLIEGLTPWTTDGENVPVMIDENGVTYFDQRAIETFRRGLVEAGVFNGNVDEATGYSPINPDYTLSEPWAFGYPVIYNELSRVYTDGGNSYLEAYGDYDFIYNYTDRFNQVHLLIYRKNEKPAVYNSYNGDISYAHNKHEIGNDVWWYVSVASGVNSSDDNPPTHLILNTNHFPNDRDILLLYMNNNDMIEGTSIPGLSPTNQTVGDLQQSLTDIFPDWALNGINYPSPKDDDLSNQTTFLPVNVTDTHPFESDHTATSGDQDGDTSDDARDDILQQMMQLIQTLTQTQTDTGTDTPIITPTIPVEDYGDTPPAIPPVISGASNGLWTIYNPTLSEVQQFGGWLWSENLIDQIIRQFNNPIEAVIGFMTLYATPITGERRVIKAGYLSSPVSAKEVTNQYITIDCGEVDVPEYYKSAIDYTRSKVEIFLPFIGIVPLDCSVVTGSTLQVIYRIDVLTGTCLAQIKVKKRNSDAVMYTYTGNCAVQLPLTASTYTGTVGMLMGLGNVVMGGLTGNAGQAIQGGISMFTSSVNNLTGTAKSGSLASNAGALGIRIPYLILTHPTAYDAMIYNQMYGYPSNEYQRLSALSGFVRVKDVHLRDITCTEQELDMIYSKLKEGIIIS